MTDNNNKSLAIPLAIFLVPKERMPLYIFEKKYKQIIDFCEETNTELCITYCTGSELKPFGSRIKILNILRRNNNEDYIVNVECTSNFKINHYNKSLETIEYSIIDSESIIDNNNLIKLFERLSGEIVNTKITISQILKKSSLSSSEKYNVIAAPNIEHQQKTLINYFKILLAQYNNKRQH